MNSCQIEIYTFELEQIEKRPLRFKFWSFESNIKRSFNLKVVSTSRFCLRPKGIKMVDIKFDANLSSFIHTGEIHSNIEESDKSFLKFFSLCNI